MRRGEAKRSKARQGMAAGHVVYRCCRSHHESTGGVSPHTTAWRDGRRRRRRRRKRGRWGGDGGADVKDRCQVHSHKKSSVKKTAKILSDGGKVNAVISLWREYLGGYVKMAANYYSEIYY